MTGPLVTELEIFKSAARALGVECDEIGAEKERHELEERDYDFPPPLAVCQGRRGMVFELSICWQRGKWHDLFRKLYVWHTSRLSICP